MPIISLPEARRSGSAPFKLKDGHIGLIEGKGITKHVHRFVGPGAIIYRLSNTSKWPYSSSGGRRKGLNIYFDEFNKALAEVENVVVEPKRRDIGGQLLETSLLYLSEAYPGIKRVELESDSNAVNFYKKIGFRKKPRRLNHPLNKTVMLTLNLRKWRENLTKPNRGRQIQQ